MDESLRTIELTKMGEGRYKATNRRGGVLPIGSGDDPDFTPVELLLAAIAGCTAIDVDLITGKRAKAESFDVHASGEKIRDDQGNHLTNLKVSFDITFPEGPDGDAARGVLQRAIDQSRDRLCTVSRTVALPTPVEMVIALNDELPPRAEGSGGSFA
jgi:putative redox protein